MSDCIRPAIWICTIGHREIAHAVLPPAADGPMREAVASVFRNLTGADDEFIFSGWGQTYIPERYAAVVDGRNVLLDETHYAAWIEAREIIALAIADDLPIDNEDDERVTDALNALTELLWYRRSTS